jgi:Na+/proline symporter
MLRHFWKTLLILYCGILIFLQPFFVFGAESSKENPDWVLSYFLVLLFLGLAVLILLRPAKRSESAFTRDELTAQQQEAMKKMKGH